MHHTTGFDREEIIDLCIRINSVQPGAGSPNWPPCLGLFKSVVAALTYMRHNRTQAEIGESLGVSQPTISRAISAVTPLVPEATREFVPTADDLDPDAQYILDGTLLPCWSWDGHKELYSGKHKTTGMNLQVACTIYGKLAWISDPVNGSRHDNYCREESGVLLTINPRNWIGDKGYIGNNMITPFRKPAGGELLDWQKEYNSEVNKIRWMIEQVISHFKNWTIMHTDYRRPLKTFETTISAVVGLHFYRTAYGWNMAELDARTRGVQSPGSYRWWLDVETVNSWESVARNNRADLEGMASYFRHIGATVGIYSTARQWNPIVGTVRPGSPLYRLPDWRPGAKTPAQAKKNCHLAPLTGGGKVDGSPSGRRGRPTVIFPVLCPRRNASEGSELCVSRARCAGLAAGCGGSRAVVGW